MNWLTLARIEDRSFHYKQVTNSWYAANNKYVTAYKRLICDVKIFTIKYEITPNILMFFPLFLLRNSPSITAVYLTTGNE